MSTFIHPVNCKFGAPMGRHTGPVYLGTEERIYLRRVRLDSGGYDSGGAYWGTGAPLYEVLDQDGNGFIFRISGDREDAKEYVKSRFPEARFYR